MNRKDQPPHSLNIHEGIRRYRHQHGDSLVFNHNERVQIFKNCTVDEETYHRFAIQFLRAMKEVNWPNANVWKSTNTDPITPADLARLRYVFVDNENMQEMVMMKITEVQDDQTLDLMHVYLLLNDAGMISSSTFIAHGLQ